MVRRRFSPPIVCALVLLACTNEDPEAFITSHVNGDVITQGWAESFAGRVTDDHSSPEELTASWYLDSEEICAGLHPNASDGVSCEPLVDLEDEALAAGEVELALEVWDEDGVLGSAAILLAVQVSEAPVVEILAPEEGLIAYSDTAVDLLGLVSDDLDDLDTLVVWWDSDLDGPISPESAADESGQVSGSALLGEGTHGITLSAEDSTGALGTASVSITVFPANTEPSCEITAPEDGSADVAGTEVTFTGFISDTEDPIADLVVSWTSDLDGDLDAFNRHEGGEVELVVDDLSLGTHTITLAAQDTGGFSCSEAISYTVGSNPVIVIDDPENDSISSAGEAIRFQATVTSATHSPQDLTMTWVSDVNGLFSSDGANSGGIASFESSELSQGAHTVTVTATDTDGFSGEALLSLVVNGVPNAPELALAPDPAFTTDALVLTITRDSSDPEGDSVTYDYAWTVDGVISSASTGTTLPSAVTDRDEVWAVTVTPNDGLSDGDAATATITISNTPPVLADAALTPEDPAAGEVLTCTPGTTTDVDGDTGFTYSTAWLVDGSPITATGSTLDDSYWGRDQSVTCVVTPNDGTDDGDPITSNTIGVVNTAPAIDTVSISPDPGQAADTLTCSYSGYVDEDGDADQSTLVWDVDGVEVGTDTTLSGVFVGGETVTCTVTPDDGTTPGTPVSGSLVVTNTAPTIDSVSIEPTTAYAGDTLVCSYSGYADDDGNADQSTYSWSLNGTTVGTSSVLETSFIRDDVLTCTVTPDDGEDAGSTVSASITVTNTAPSIEAVSLSPESPQAGDTLTCTYSGYDDADGDADASTYSWTIDGVSAGSGTDSLSSGFIGGELVVCTITPDDGTDAGTAVSASATIGNTAPSIDSVAISPTAAVVGDTLTCTYTGFDDSDGDPDESTLAWTIDGETISTSDTLEDFVGGDTVTCTVTPYDGKSTGSSLSDSLVIDNTAPTIDSVTISPASPTTGETLSCSHSGYSDVDGDADQSTYAWTINGSSASTGSTLSGDFVGGDTIICTVTPDDGAAQGTPVSDTVFVDNTAPSIASVSISPPTPQADDTLSCNYDGFSDPDDDEDQSTFAWTIEDTTVGTDSELSGAFFGGDTVTCTVTPSDGSAEGTALSAEITIENTAPGIENVTISPSEATTSDALTCSHDGYVDIDEDADQSTYVWSVNGSPVSTDTTLTSGYVGGDTVTCTVTPDDGTDSGTAVSESIDILNSPPVVDSVSISPTDPEIDDTLTCSYSGYSDADGESDQSTLNWTVNGSEEGDSTTLAGVFLGGDTVVCTVTPYDGNENGDVVSATVVIDNTAPSITSVTISPADAQAGETLTCTYEGFIDPDGDDDESTYSWDVDGTEVDTSSTISSGFVGGQTVTCTVTPSDGSTEGTSLSDSLVVTNTAPEISTVTISPSSAQVGDTLTCSHSGYSDADGDADQSTYGWAIDGLDAGVTTDEISSGFVGGNEVTCTVIPSDGSESGTAVSDSLLITNSAPTIDSVTISPSSAQVGDTLTCGYSGFFDADGNTDQSTYSWTLSGTEVGTTDTLSSGFVGGDNLTCTVTPSDGEDEGVAGSDSLTIGNTPPTIDSVTISPSSAQVGETLSCAYDGFIDADDDSDQSTLVWTVNGSSVSTDTDLSSDFVGGDTVTCTVTPDDGQDAGTALSDSLVIDNTAPEITSVTITPTSAQAGETLTCTHEGFSDGDGDADQSTYEWDVNGTTVSLESTLSSDFIGGDTVTCTVTPYDGTDNGTALSDSLVIDNTAPSITSVNISPASPAVTDDLTCTYADYVDVDGDADQSTFEWTVNGDSAGATDTLLSGAFASGDTVICTVTPYDGEDEGTEASASVTVGNTAPTITSVAIDPTSAKTGDLLTCNYSGYSDVDGDADESTYRWTINGSTAGTNSTLFSGFVGGDTVACTVTPYDGFGTGTALDDSLVIDNTAPSIDSVTITPSTPVTGDTLTCTYSGFDDPDGDGDLSNIVWTVNGVEASTESTLDGGFVGGDTVTCTVTPSDGSDGGSAVSESVTVDNTAPSITSVSISPSSARAGDTLTCSYSDFSDPDGEADASTIAWTVDGTTLGTTSTFSSGFYHGDEVTCTVTPSDGTDEGTALSDSITIDNTAPVLTDVTLSPDPAFEGDTLSCTPGSASDADGESVSYTYAWYLDGSSLSETGSTLSSDDFDRDEDVFCSVTPTDGTDDGSSVDSNSIVISNSSPSIASVSVSPSDPNVDDTLTCSYSDFEDGDGDSDASTYSWKVDGLEVSTDSTLTGSFTRDNDVTCTVTPHDGTDEGTAVSDSVTIANSAPVLTEATLSPDPAYGGDTLTCTPGTTTDADDDTVSYDFAWTVSGSSTGETGSTLSSSFFVRDETVVCQVTPSDGTDEGEAVDSDTLTISNTVPVVSDVSVSPEPAVTADTLTCSYSYADADGDGDSSTFSWTVNGTEVGTSSTLSGEFVFQDEVICTVTGNDGTDEGTSSSSSPLTVDNTAPSISSVSISPSSPNDLDTLTCSYTGYSDADGNADQSMYSWSILGSVVGTSADLGPSNFSRHDDVVCEVTPFDGTDSGTPLDDSVNIASSNTPPEILSLTLSPSTVYTDDVISASVSATDDDGDSITLVYEWTVDGAPVSVTSASLDGASYFDKGDEVSCEVTPYDGDEFGSAETSSTITIENTEPGSPTISINDFTSGLDDILCNVDADSVDADEDLISYAFTWTADGLTYPDAFGSATGPATTNDTDDTVPGVDSSLASTWICTVTPNDGEDDGPSASVTAIELTEVEYGFPDPIFSPLSVSTDFLQGNLVTVDSDFRITNLSIYLHSVGIDTTVVMGLYESSSSSPTNLVAYTLLEPAVSGWNDLDVVLDVDVPAGDYFLAWNFGGTSSPEISVDNSGGIIASVNATATSPPKDPFNPSSVASYTDVNIYALGYE